jgi:multiple sugar transport system substrate-binding protein
MRRVVVLVTLLAMVFGTFGVIGSAADLTFVCPAWQGDTVKEIKAIVAEWNDAHPDIQVEIIWQAWENLDDYLLTSFQGGQAPDIFHEDAVVCYEYGQLGYAAPLNDYLNEETLADIPASNWEEVSDDEGTIYGIPLLQETLVIFYNKTLFADAGITIPADGLVTWDELRDYAQRLTKRDENGEVTTWGLLAPLEQRLWWCLVEQNEGHVLQRHDDGTWHVEIDENAKEAIKSFTDLVTVDQTMPQDILSYDFMSLLQGFKSGKYAMFSYGCWVRSWIERLTKGDLDWGMLQIKGEKKIVTEADPQALGIYVNSPHRDEAAQFVEFFTNTENSARIAYADWLFPVRQSALERPEFQTEEGQWNIAYQWLPYAQDVKPHMFGFFAWEWQSFLPQIELVILGKEDLATALDDATTQGNLFLRRMGLQ